MQIFYYEGYSSGNNNDLSWSSKSTRINCHSKDMADINRKNICHHLIILNQELIPGISKEPKAWTANHRKNSDNREANE